MKRWNKAGGKVLKGLERRREAEAALLYKGVVLSGECPISTPATASLGECLARAVSWRPPRVRPPYQPPA
jgi:hypothetical protein